MESRDQSDNLYHTIKHGDVVAVREYLARGGAVRGPRQTGWALIQMAANEGDTPIIQLLLHAGADVNEGWPSRHAPLMLAAMTGSGPAVRLLLARGARTDAEGYPAPELLRLLGYGKQTKILDIIQKSMDSKV